MKEQRFDKNVYMEFFYWLYQSLASSLCFWFVNILYIAAAFLLSIDGRNVFSFIFSLLFIGPGCIVMIGMTEELAKEKSFSSVRLFIKTFRRFWLKGFFYWLFAWIVSVIMIFDCFFFIRFSYGKWLIPLFVLLACLSVSFSINCWYFQVRNPASKPNQVLRIAFYYTLKKWYVSLLDFLLLTSLFLFFFVKPQWCILLGPSIVFGLIYFNNRKLMRTMDL